MEQGREEEPDVAEGGLDGWWFRRGTPRAHRALVIKTDRPDSSLSHNS